MLISSPHFEQLIKLPMVLKPAITVREFQQKNLFMKKDICLAGISWHPQRFISINKPDQAIGDKIYVLSCDISQISFILILFDRVTDISYI